MVVVYTDGEVGHGTTKWTAFNHPFHASIYYCLTEFLLLLSTIAINCYKVFLVSVVKNTACVYISYFDYTINFHAYFV